MSITLKCFCAALNNVSKNSSIKDEGFHLNSSSPVSLKSFQSCAACALPLLHLRVHRSDSLPSERHFKRCSPNRGSTDSSISSTAAKNVLPPKALSDMFPQTCAFRNISLEIMSNSKYCKRWRPTDLKTHKNERRKTCSSSSKRHHYFSRLRGLIAALQSFFWQHLTFFQVQCMELSQMMPGVILTTLDYNRSLDYNLPLF